MKHVQFNVTHDRTIRFHTGETYPVVAVSLDKDWYLVGTEHGNRSWVHSSFLIDATEKLPEEEYYYEVILYNENIGSTTISIWKDEQSANLSAEEFNSKIRQSRMKIGYKVQKRKFANFI